MEVSHSKQIEISGNFFNSKGLKQLECFNHKIPGRQETPMCYESCKSSNTKIRVWILRRVSHVKGLSSTTTQYIPEDISPKSWLPAWDGAFGTPRGPCCREPSGDSPKIPGFCKQGTNFNTQSGKQSYACYKPSHEPTSSTVAYLKQCNAKGMLKLNGSERHTTVIKKGTGYIHIHTGDPIYSRTYGGIAHWRGWTSHWEKYATTSALAIHILIHENQRRRNFKDGHKKERR